MLSSNLSLCTATCFAAFSLNYVLCCGALPCVAPCCEVPWCSTLCYILGIILTGRECRPTFGACAIATWYCAAVWYHVYPNQRQHPHKIAAKFCAYMSPWPSPVGVPKIPIYIRDPQYSRLFPLNSIHDFMYTYATRMYNRCPSPSIPTLHDNLHCCIPHPCVSLISDPLSMMFLYPTFLFHQPPSCMQTYPQ